MNSELFVPVQNPGSLTQLGTWFAEHYHWLDQALRSSEWTIPIFVCLFLLGTALWVPGVKTKVFDMYCNLGRYMAGAIKGWKMRKERVAEQRQLIKSKLMDWIDDEVEAGRMTELEANAHYREYARVHWDLRHCIVKLRGKDKAMEAIVNADRNPDGTIKVIPFPDGDASPAPAKA